MSLRLKHVVFTLALALLTCASVQAFPTQGMGVGIRAGRVLQSNRTDFVAISSATAGGPGKLQIFPSDPALPPREIPLSGPVNNLKLIDVADLNSDGRDEIVLINGTTTLPNTNIANPDGAVYLVDATRTTAQQPVVRASQDGSGRSSGIGVSNVKIYQRQNGTRSVLVVPGTPGTLLPGSLFFFHAGVPGPIINLPPFENCSSESCNDGLEFPNIAVDNIDNVGGKEIVVLSKSRLLLFDEAGTELFRSQFVDDDDNARFTRYDAVEDPVGPQGRRYGHVQIVPSLDGDGIKDLIAVADSLPLPTPGDPEMLRPLVIQAFPLKRPPGEYLEPLVARKVSRGNKGLTPAGEPPIGLPVNGIQDVDGAGLPEVVVTHLRKNGKPLVEVFTASGASWARIGRKLPGTALDVLRTDPSSNLPDIVIWNRDVAQVQFWRWSPSLRDFEMVASVNTPKAPAQQDSSNFSLSGPELERHGSTSDFSRLIPSRFGDRTFVIVDNKTTATPCGTVDSYRIENRTLVRGLMEPTNPGRFEFLIPGANSRFLINRFDAACKVNGNVEPFIQDSAGRLMPETGGGGGGGTPSLGVSPASLTFSGTAGGTNPGNQFLSITSSGAALSWSATDNVSWLTVSPASGSTPASPVVSVNLAGLTAGTYTGTITVSSATQTQTVAVTLIVQAAPVSTLGVSPTSLSFSGTQGGSNPANQSLSITSTGTSLSWNATDTASWLTVSPASGVTPISATV
ncbi:MAG TPA: BACON domain-containing carbohydrate-binding protein, partial [Thermoanaerobaculia bacterium]|nr:BACON domain-containing carbohydrate-binding protein [Thermoanaerobaculia bacterium]